MIHLWWLYLAMFRYNAADNSEQGMQKMDVTSQNWYVQSWSFDRLSPHE